MVMMMTFTDLLWFISSSAILLVKYWSTAVMLNISCQSWRYIRSVGVVSLSSWLCLALRFLEETTVGVAITSQCFVATHTVLLTSKHLQRTTWSSKTNTWVLLNNNTLLVGFNFYGRTRWTTSCYRNVFLLLVLIQNSPSTSQQGTVADTSSSDGCQWPTELASAIHNTLPQSWILQIHMHQQIEVCTSNVTNVQHIARLTTWPIGHSKTWTSVKNSTL